MFIITYYLYSAIIKKPMSYGLSDCYTFSNFSTYIIWDNRRKRGISVKKLSNEKKKNKCVFQDSV